jgi:hypothetical protein
VEVGEACATALADQVGHGRATMLFLSVFGCFLDMLQAHVSSVSIVSNVCFIRMLQK